MTDEQWEAIYRECCKKDFEDRIYKEIEEAEFNPPR